MSRPTLIVKEKLYESTLLGTIFFVALLFVFSRKKTDYQCTCSTKGMRNSALRIFPVCNNEDNDKITKRNTQCVY